MPYAQKNYPNSRQGIPPTIYTIAQIGCFITSFCNLVERYGQVVDPPMVNQALVDRNAYIDVDDGVRDDVAWDTVSVINGNVSVARTGVGSPPNNNCIVKFVYDGGKTHFCLVADASRGLILDSWDGQVKSWSLYGGPKAWAEYNYNEPQQGGDMPEKIDLSGGRILTEEILGRDRDATHRGDYDADINANRVGHDLTNAELYALWTSDEAQASATLKQKQKNFYNQYSSVIGELSARPTKQEYQQAIDKLAPLQFEVDKAHADLKTAREEAQKLKDQQASDTQAGDSFLRRIGQFIGKYLPKS